ncbi:MAG: TRAP transporter substrate-binding protein DctP [Dehalococcoidia bacterium]|nr:TRAP transporter substrate-binding protein DctP [Dehalococcoidia bacterium]
MRKLLLVLMTLALAGSIVACAAPATPTTPTTPAPTTTPTTPTTPTTTPATGDMPASSGQKANWTMNWGYAPAMSADGAAGSPNGRFEQTLLEKSQGRFTLDIRETMVPREQELDFIARNNAQLGDMSITYVAGTYPLLDFGALPFRFSDIWEYEKCMNDPDMIGVFDKVLRDAGIEYLSSLPSGNMKFIWGKEPLTTVASFKDIKLRTTGAVATKAFQLLGAAPVSIPGPEMGDAMYRGVVDACVTTLDYGVEQGLDAFSTAISVWSVMPVISGAWCANLEAYNKLPADLKWALDETAKEVSRQQYYAAVPEFAAYLAWVSSTNISIVYPDMAEVVKARTATTETVNDWLKTAGPYGQQVLDISARYIPK